jgi:hypothetical protein
MEVKACAKVDSFDRPMAPSDDHVVQAWHEAEQAPQRGR